MEGLEPQSSVRPGLLSQWPTLPCWRQGQVSTCSHRSSKSWALFSSLFVLGVCFLSPPSTGTLISYGAVLEQDGAVQVLDVGLSVWIMASLVTKSLDCCRTASVSTINSCPCLFRHCSGSELPLATLTLVWSWAAALAGMADVGLGARYVVVSAVVRIWYYLIHCYCKRW